MGVDPAGPQLAFLQAVADDPEWASQAQDRLRAYNRDHGALYDGEPIPVTLTPYLVTPGQRVILETAAREITGALDAFVDWFLNAPEDEQPWRITDEERRLFEVDPGYENAAPVARFDGFLDGDRLTLLEFNTDSPGGAGYGDVVQAAYEEFLERNPQLGKGVSLTSDRRIPALADALEACYRAWRSRNAPDRPREPTTVVTDWRDVGSRPDIDITVPRLAEHGLDARFADPRELKLDGDELVHEGDRVDLVYKRVIVDELLDEPEAEALATAFQAGTVCMANPPRSVLAGDKRTLGVLQSDAFQDELTDSQRRAVDRFLPWTRILEPGRTTVDGYSVELRDFVLDNQDRLVLKAAVSYGGKDVVLGPNASSSQWGKLVDEHIKTGDWVVQRLVDLPKALFPRVDDGRVELRSLNVNVNPFVLGGRYGGGYTRVSADDVVNISAGGGLVPTFTLEADGEAA